MSSSEATAAPPQGASDGSAAAPSVAGGAPARGHLTGSVAQLDARINVALAAMGDVDAATRDGLRNAIREAVHAEVMCRLAATYRRLDDLTATVERMHAAMEEVQAAVNSARTTDAAGVAAMHAITSSMLRDIDSGATKPSSANMIGS